MIACEDSDVAALALVEMALRDVLGHVPAVNLPTDMTLRSKIVARIEVLRDGRRTMRLTERARTVGDLIRDVERVFTPGTCGLCREDFGRHGCRYCPRPPHEPASLPLEDA